MTRKIGFALVGALLLFLVLESAVRVLGWAIDVDYAPGVGYTRRPTAVIFEPHPYLQYVLKPGVSWRGKTPQGNTMELHINSMGFRGAEISAEKRPDTCRVISLGGSSTLGSYLSDDETYTAQMESILDQRVNDRIVDFEVINAGISGYTTAESLLNLSLRLLDYSPDVVTIYQAYNDLKAAQSSSFKSDYSHSAGPLRTGDFLDQSRLIGSIRYELITRIRSRLSTSSSGEKSDEPLPEGVAAFSRNVRSLVYLAKGNGIGVVLSTQATPLSEATLSSHPDKFQAVVGYLPRLTYQGMMKGFAEYNKAVASIAQEEGVALVRNYELIPQDFEHFVDHVHFTPKGARLLASNFADAVFRECSKNFK